MGVVLIKNEGAKFLKKGKVINIPNLLRHLEIHGILTRWVGELCTHGSENIYSTKIGVHKEKLCENKCTRCERKTS